MCKPDALSRRPDYVNFANDSDVPFTVLRPENFCALVHSASSLNNEILSGYKSDSFYHDVCTYLDNKKTSYPS